MNRTTSDHSPRPGVWVIVGLLLLYAFIRSVVAAGGRVFWYDELLTQLVVAQRSWHDVLSALYAPLDGQPPLFYIIERLTLSLPVRPEIALRLPSALAFVFITLLIFVYVRRHGSAAVAFCCSTFLLMTSLFKYYALEARPYSLVIACIALAMVCYQRVSTAWRWVVVLGASLTLAQSLHYLSVLAIVPFGLAELTETRITRQWRYRVWAALCFPLTALLFELPLMRLNRAYYGAHHVTAGFRFSDLPQIFGEYFLANSQLGTAIVAAALVSVLAAVLFSADRLSMRDRSAQRAQEISQAVFLVVLIALPFVGFAFAKAAHAGLTARYVLSATLGMAGGFGYALNRESRRAVFVFAAFVIAAVSVAELHFWRFQAAERHATLTASATIGRFLNDAGHADLPIVVPNGDILRFANYPIAGGGSRFVYLVHVPGAEHDTLDKGVLLASRYTSLTVREFSEFVAEHRQFLAMAEGPDQTENWLTSKMLRDHWQLQILAADGVRTLFLLTQPARERS